MTERWKRRLVAHPLVALDWGYVRSMARDAAALSDRFNYIMPETALLEASTATAVDSTGLAIKLLDFLRKNHSRVFLASHPGHFSTIETKPNKLAPRLHIANRPWFETSDDAGSVDVALLRQRVETVSESNHPLRSIQLEFEEGRREFSRIINELAASSGDRIECWPLEKTVAEVCKPSAAAGYATLFEDKYKSRDWQDALAVFPDRHAVGRWWRIALWYWLREARGIGARRLRNDWADSTCLFVASYSDLFWTADEEAAQLARILFTNVRVLCFSPEEVRARHRAGGAP